MVNKSSASRSGRCQPARIQEPQLTPAGLFKLGGMKGCSEAGSKAAFCQVEHPQSASSCRWHVSQALAAVCLEDS